MILTSTAFTVASAVTAVGELVTGAVSWINSYLGVITGNGLLLFFAVMSAVGLGVGLIRRMIRL